MTETILDHPGLPGQADRAREHAVVIGDPPCIGCMYYQQCAKELTACQQFVRWVNTGTASGTKAPDARHTAIFRKGVKRVTE
jgi:hypothetical protein